MTTYIVQDLDRANPSTEHPSLTQAVSAAKSRLRRYMDPGWGIEATEPRPGIIVFRPTSFGEPHDFGVSISEVTS